MDLANELVVDIEFNTIQQPLETIDVKVSRIVHRLVDSEKIKIVIIKDAFKVQHVTFSIEYFRGQH